MKLEFHPDAEIEINESAFYYESKVKGLGYRFIDEVGRHSKLLSKYPELGQFIEDNIRHLVFEQFPYSFIYTIEAECIWILAVAHQHKKPGYWHERIKL